MTPTPDIPVVITPKPFSPAVERVFAPEGATIAQMLLEAVREGFLPLADVPRVNVYLDGDRLDRGSALDVIPRAGQIVNLAVEPAGGGNGERSQGDKVIETLVAIAVIAVSVIVGSTQGIQFGVGMLIRATLTPLRDIDELADGKNRSPLDGASNGFRVREPFPLMLGSGRVAFDIAAMPYTSNVNDVVWLHLVLGVHYGPCQVDDIKIGETLLADMPAGDVFVDYRLDGSPYTSELYPSDVFQDPFGDEITVARSGEPIEWEVHTAQPGAEQIELDFTFPQGLKFTKESGGLLRNEVQIVIERAEVGTEVWTAPVLLGAPYLNRHGVPVPTGNFYVAALSNDSLSRTVAIAGAADKHYKFRVRAFDPDDDERDRVVNKTFWSAVRSINFTPPILDDTLSVIVLKIRSTDDLNGQLPTVTGVVTPIVPVWTGSAWGAPAASGNFAACARWLVTGPAAGNPMTAEQVDDSFGAAFDLIEANGWDGLVEVRGEATQEDVLRRLGAAGRFSTYWNGRALVAVPDWSRPTPRQIFTTRNAAAYRYRRGFPDPLHAYMVEFIDLEGLDDEVFVYADGYGPENAEIIESLRPPFACSIERAYRYGALMMLRREVQQEVHEWQAGWDTLATTMGDRVLVRHPSAVIGLGEAKVAVRRWAGALVRGLRLDGYVSMEEGKSYAIDVRRVDGTIRGIPVVTVPGRQRELVFPAPRTVELSPERGDLIAFGEVAMVTEDVEILDVEASSDMAATVRAVRYIGEEIVALEAEPLPTGLASSLVPKVPPPQPRIIDVNGSPDGAVVAFDIDPIRANLLAGFAVRWRRSPDPAAVDVTGEDWVPLPNLPPSARQVRTPSLAAFGFDPDDLDSIVEIDVEIRTLFRSGAVSLPGIAERIAGYRFVLPPENFSAVPVIVYAGSGGGSYPAIDLAADPVTSGPITMLEVQYRSSLITGTESADDDEWSYLAGLEAATALSVKRVNGPAVYDVRARWKTFDGWVSVWVYQNEVEVPIDQYDTPQVVEGANFRITSDQDFGVTVIVPSQGGSPGYEEVKSMDFDVDYPASKFTIHFSIPYTSYNSNISRLYVKIGTEAPNWSGSGAKRMTNADLTILVSGFLGPVTLTFAHAGLSVGPNTLEIYCNSEGSGSHINEFTDPFFQVREDKKAA